MSRLTIEKIIKHLEHRTLPKDYQLKPASITKEQLTKVLSLFTDHQQMIEFIVKLTESQDASIVLKENAIPLGSKEKFFHAFAQSKLHENGLSKNKQDVILAHLRQNQFNKQQLKYLVEKLNSDLTRDLLLNSKCFVVDELIELCCDPILISKLEIENIKLLYYFLNPQRQWDAPKTPLLDMYYFAYRVGHVIGISKKIRTKYRSIELTIESEGDYRGVSLKLLTSVVNAYRQAHPSKMWDDIFYAINATVPLVKDVDVVYKENTHLKLYKRYQSHQLTYVATGWRGHAVGLAFYGDYVVYCNRGQGGDRHFGCKIYKIKEMARMDANFFKEITSTKSQEAFKNVLGKIIDFNDSVAKFKSKGQKRGVCAFANAKACIEGMIVLAQAGPKASVAELRKIALKEVKRKKYKDFTNFARDREVDELIKNMFFASDPDLIHFYAILAKEIIEQHHGKGRGSIKDEQEIIRAVDLFDRLPNKIQTIVRQDQDFMALIEQLRGSRDRLFSDRGIAVNRWPHHQYIHDKKKHCSHKLKVDNGYITSIDGMDTPKTLFNYKNAQKMIRLFG